MLIFPFSLLPSKSFYGNPIVHCLHYRAKYARVIANIGS